MKDWVLYVLLGLVMGAVGNPAPVICLHVTLLAVTHLDVCGWVTLLIMTSWLLIVEIKLRSIRSISVCACIPFVSPKELMFF